MMIELFLALTIHFAPADHNQIHPHIRYSDESFIVGSYYNSLDHVSLYVGLRHGDKYWIEYGAVTGYETKIAQTARAGVQITDDIGVYVAPVYYNEDNVISGLVGIEFKLW